MKRTWPFAFVLIAFTACRGATDDRERQPGERADLEAGEPSSADAGEGGQLAPDGRRMIVTTIDDTLAPGTAAAIRLENLSDRPIGFNLCPKILERRTEDAWEPLPESRPEACTLELRILAAGETVEGSTGIPTGIVPGTYHIVFEGISFEQGEPGISPEERTSNAFEVRSPTP